jgi:hypothetical protein
MGSLAAGASAVMGTGALSESDLERSMTGRIANDANAYVQFTGGRNNGQHVTYQNGMMVLDFGNLGSNVGAGLNDESVNYFDDTFVVHLEDQDQADGGGGGGQPLEDYWLWITETTSANGRIDFYRDGDPTQSIVGSGQAIKLTKPSNNGNLSRQVGVCIDLTGTTAQPGANLSSIFGSGPHFTVHIEEDDGSVQAAPQA